MSPATALTVGVLALLLVVAMLACAVGMLIERGRRNRSDDQTWADGFNAGCGYEGKAKHIERRARVLGR